MTQAASSPRWLRTACTVMLVLLSVQGLLNSVGVALLFKQTQVMARDAQAANPTARLTAIEQQLDAARQQPAPISQATLASERKSMDERFAQLEQSITNIRADVLQSIQTPIREIETTLAALQQTPATPVTPPARQRVTPKTTEPSFRVVGIELRGGERFLSIAPAGQLSLAQVRLLRPGDSEGAWRLESIESTAATFRVNGQVQRLALP